MKNFEALTEPEKALRSMIFAAETRHLHHVAHPAPMGDAYLGHVLQRAKQVAEKHGIPLVNIDSNDYLEIK